MTVHDIFSRAMLRLGYCSVDGSIPASPALRMRALEAYNTVAEDLRLDTAEDLLSELSLSPAQSEAAICGMGMILALGDGDSEKNRLFAELYNLKRAAAKAAASSVADSLPRVIV